MSLDFSSEELSKGELAVLQCLRDGDDPMLSVPQSQWIFFARDVARLMQRGLVERSGSRMAMTLAGLERLSNPASFWGGL